MAISPHLFRAILAMDSYNRGYNAGLLLDPNATEIGTATLAQQSNTTAGSLEVSAGFFAQAYTWNGQTVISYRGTDVLPPNSWADVAAWSLAFASNYDTAQARLAAQFYQQVYNAPHVGEISTTGHSLGGALAGFVAALYGSDAMLFSNIAFRQAAINLVSELRNSPASNAELLDRYFGFLGGALPTWPLSFSSPQFGGYAIDGEVADLVRTAEEMALLQTISLGSNIGILDIVIS